MPLYNPAKPIFFIHTAKTGGTSVKQVLKTWFPNKVVDCYLIDPHKLSAEEHLRDVERLRNILAESNPFTVYYGHIPLNIIPQNSSQFITFLRNPFNRLVSFYFHRKRGQDQPGAIPLIFESCEDFIRHTLKPTVQFPMLGGLKSQGVSLQNYKEHINKRYLFVGVMEHLQKSVNRLAGVLGKQTMKVQSLNTSAKLTKNIPERLQVMYKDSKHHKYDEPIPEHLREEFEAKYALDVAIHRYVLSQFE